MNRDQQAIAAELLDEQVQFTLREVVRLCGVPADQLVELVAEGIVEPSGPPKPPHWRFSGTSVVRIQTALRLQQDLGLDQPATALVLELLDRVNALQRRLRQLESGSLETG